MHEPTLNKGGVSAAHPKNDRPKGTGRLSAIRIGPRIWGGFGIVLILTALVGAVGWRGIGDYAARVDAAGRASNLVEIVLRARAEERNFVIEGDPAFVGKVGEWLDRFRDEAGAFGDRSGVDRTVADGLIDGIKGYEDGFAYYVDEETTKGKTLAAMNTAAETLVATADSVRIELNKQLQRVLADLKELQARRDGLMTRAETVDGLNGVLDAAVKQKEAYATSNDPDDQKAFEASLDSVAETLTAQKADADNRRGREDR